MDLKNLTDDELDAHANAVAAEAERRRNLALIPDQIATLRQQYVDGGGDPADLGR